LNQWIQTLPVAVADADGWRNRNQFAGPIFAEIGKLKNNLNTIISVS